MVPVPPDPRFDQLRRWTRLLDTAFRIPGTNLRFGWDPILGLVPGLGDLVTPIFGALLLVHAFGAGVPKVVQLRMVLNVLLDVVGGLLPVVGDLFDLSWKANAKNLALLERHAGGQTKPTRGDWVFVGGAIAIMAACAAIPLVIIGWLISRFGWL
jgi:hypothetical protein